MVDPPPASSTSSAAAATVVVTVASAGSGVRQTIESFHVPLLLPSERRRKQRRKEGRNITVSTSGSGRNVTASGSSSSSSSSAASDGNGGNGVLSRLGLIRSRRDRDRGRGRGRTPVTSSITASTSRVPSNASSTSFSSSSSSLSIYYDKEQYPPNMPPHFLDSEPERTRHRTQQLWKEQLWPAVDKLLRALETRSMNRYYRQIVFKSSMYNVCKEFNRSTENVKVELKNHQQLAVNTSSSNNPSVSYSLEVSLLTEISSTIRNARSYTAEIPQVGTDMIPVMSHYVGTTPTTTPTPTPTASSSTGTVAAEASIVVETETETGRNDARNGGRGNAENFSAVISNGSGPGLRHDQEEAQQAEVVEIVSLRDGYQQLPLLALQQQQQHLQQSQQDHPASAAAADNSYGYSSHGHADAIILAESYLHTNREEDDTVLDYYDDGDDEQQQQQEERHQERPNQIATDTHSGIMAVMATCEPIDGVDTTTTTTTMEHFTTATTTTSITDVEPAAAVLVVIE